MATFNPEASPEAVAAVARLSQVVADPEWRRSFVADPIPALERANIVVAHIPQRLLESLQSLSEEELEVLARICPELVEAGFYVEVPDYGRVCYYQGNLHVKPLPGVKLGEGERLRRKIMLLLPSLIEVGQNLLAHSRIADLYPEYLITMHWIVRGSVPLMEAARARADAMAEDDPVSARLAIYLAEHIPEEMHHDEWALNDLEVLGRDRSSVLAKAPSPTVAGLVGAQYYWIFHYHPVALLGYIAVLEGYPPSREQIEDLIARTGHRPEAFRTVLAHAELDGHHRSVLDETLDGLPLTKEQSTVIGLNAMYTVHTLARAIDEITNGSGWSSSRSS